MSNTDDAPWIVNALAILEQVRDGDHGVRLEVEPSSGARARLFSVINELLDAAQNERRQRGRQKVELEEALSAIELVRASMREISAPIIEVWRGVLCVPLVGILDPGRRAEAEASLLARVSAQSARCVIVDVTGLSALDEGSAAWLVGLSRAVELLGARCVLTGIGGELAEALMRLDTDVARLVTLGSVRDALARHANGRL